MDWKAMVVGRLRERNKRENDPFYEMIFSLLDKQKTELLLKRATRRDELLQTLSSQVLEASQGKIELQSLLNLTKAQLDEKVSSFNKLKFESGQMEEKNNKLETDHNSALAEKAALEEKIQSLQNECDEKSFKISELERQLAEFRKENEDFLKARGLLDEEGEAYRNTIARLTERLVEQTMSNNQSSFRSLSVHHEPTAEPQRTSAPTSVSADGSPTQMPSSPSGHSLAVVTGAFNRFAGLFRVSNSSHSLSQVQGPGEDAEFQILQYPDFFVSCSYPTKVITDFEAHENGCSAVSWSPNSRYLATAGFDRMLKLWRFDGFSGPATLGGSITGCPPGIRAIEFDPSEHFLGVGCSDNTARIYQLSLKRELHVLTGHTDWVTAICFGGSCNAGMATASRDRTIRLWDSAKFYSLLKTIVYPSRCNDLVLLSGGGFVMASAHTNRNICLWDHRIEGSTPALQIDLHDKVISLDVVTSRPNEIVALTKDNNSLNVVDYRQNRVIRSFSSDGFIVSSDYAKAALSPDGQFVCAGSMQGERAGSLYVWNTNTGDTASVVEPNQKDRLSPIIAVAWQPNGRYVASIDKSKYCTLWSNI